MCAMFLNGDELVELTNKKQSRPQLRALKTMGIEHRIRPDGTPAVSEVVSNYAKMVEGGRIDKDKGRAVLNAVHKRCGEVSQSIAKHTNLPMEGAREGRFKALGEATKKQLEAMQKLMEELKKIIEALLRAVGLGRKKGKAM